MKPGSYLSCECISGILIPKFRAARYAEFAIYWQFKTWNTYRKIQKTQHTIAYILHAQVIGLSVEPHFKSKNKHEANLP